jgi:antitoxin FitA
LVGIKNQNGFTLVPTRPLHTTMSTTLTLKNIPDALYRCLKQSAEFNRRSLNSELITQLEARLLPHAHSTAQRLARVRALRQGLPVDAFSAMDISALKQEGRP